MTGTTPGLADFQAAAERIKNEVRRTPCIRARFLHEPLCDARLMLKLECLQVTGSFKPRGVMSTVTTLSPEEIGRGIITASGGNHGLAVAYVGQRAKTRATIYLPESTLPAKARKLATWGAEVVIEGEVWDDANEAALLHAERDGLTYLHPFARPEVIAGQGTLGLEILKQVADADMLVVAIGGGGLISGIATAAKAVKPDIQIIGVEPVGAPTLKASLEAGALVTLPKVETSAVTLAPKRSAPINLDLIARNVDDIVLVSDEEMRRSARWLWFEFGVAAELSGAASLAALQTGRITPAAGSTVVALVCGAGDDGIEK